MNQLWIIRYSDGLINCYHGTFEQANLYAEKHLTNKNVTYVIT